MKFGVKEMRNELMEKAGEELGKKRKEKKRKESRVEEATATISRS